MVRAERILREWANIIQELQSREDLRQFDRLFARYPEMRLAEDVELSYALASRLSAYLRFAWDAKDIRHFDWYTFTAVQDYRLNLPSSDQQLAEIKGRLKSEDPDAFADDAVADQFARSALQLMLLPEKPSIVEALFFHLRHNRRRALHCPNPDCPAPYFFATKKAQKYCSPECAAPAQREAKRKWWAENRAKGGKHADKA